MKVLDLFCGMGGLSYGFVKAGFQVTGVDINPSVKETYTDNISDNFVQMDLMRSSIKEKFDIIIGGPPCKPWSCLNLQRRREAHPLYGCLESFFRHVWKQKPVLFIMENVPAIRSDPNLSQYLTKTSRWFDVKFRVIKYSDFGAATARRRLFIFGIRFDQGVGVEKIIQAIQESHYKTVKHAIGYLRYKVATKAIDHVWPRFRTIEKYRHYYKTGKYGWYILEWEKPAKSFGNVTKTYTLHPDSFNGGRWENQSARVISVREALAITGFGKDFSLPVDVSLRQKYQMIADSVSPDFSQKLAEAVSDKIDDSIYDS